MNLDDHFKSMSMAGVDQSVALEVGNGSSGLGLKHQASLNMANGLSMRTVNQVWREIQQGEKMKMMTSNTVVKTESVSTVGEMTLEDFLAKAGASDESSSSPVKNLDTRSSLTLQSFSQQMGMSHAPSLGALSDSPVSGRKRDAPDVRERSIERKLRRKIKNRESAARSRARKQAYQNELVGKVSCLEVENLKLKREKNRGHILSVESKYCDLNHPCGKVCCSPLVPNFIFHGLLYLLKRNFDVA
ncbi:hypothetical protein Dimus_009808 [Dionaea muscipula]